MAGRKKKVEAKDEAKEVPRKKSAKTKTKKSEKKVTKRGSEKSKKDAVVSDPVTFYDPANVDYLADCVVKNPGLIAQLEQLGFKSKNPEGMTFREAMMCSQISSAVRGDIDAYKAVMNYSGGKKSRPIDRLLEDGNRLRPIDRLK